MNQSAQGPERDETRVPVGKNGNAEGPGTPKNVRSATSIKNRHKRQAGNRYKSTVPDTKGEVLERTHQQDRRSLEAYDKIRKEEKVTVSGYGARRLYASKNKKGLKSERPRKRPSRTTKRARLHD